MRNDRLTTRRAVAWAAACLAALPVVPAALGQSTHDLRGEALRLYAEGKYAEALPVMDRVLKAKPHDLDLLNKRGAIHIRMNRPDLALPDLTAATNDVPFLFYDAMGLSHQFAPDVQLWRTPNLYAPYVLYESAFTNRGIALTMLGRDDDALADFQKSIAIRTAQGRPLNPEASRAWRAGLCSAYCGIGQVYHRKGDDARALGFYDKAIAANPDDPNGYVGRGAALSGLGRPDEAIPHFDKALTLDPNHPRAAGLRASALDALGRTDEALDAYEAAVRANPDQAMLRRMRGALLSRVGRHEEALPDFDEAIRLDPNDAASLKDRGGVYNRMGRYDRALADLDAAIRLDPKSAKAFQNRSATHNGLGRYAEAVADCDSALKLDPKNAGALNNRGLALSALGRYEKSLADLTAAVRLQPALASAYFNRGNVYALLGEPDRAESDFDEVIRRQPALTVAVARAKDARAQSVAAGRRSRGRDFTPPDAPSGSSADAQAARDLGNARRASGDWPGAVAAYSRAIELEPEGAEAYAFRGWARLIGGEPGADGDARRWFGLKGWRDPFAPYMALLGVLAAHADGRDLAASAFLDEAIANARPGGLWPTPLFRYLKGALTADGLVAAAGRDPKSLTEAHAVIGLDLLSRGDREAATPHLTWALDQGLDRSIARDLAREALRRGEP